MFTSDILVPFPPSQKPFCRKLSASTSNSNQLDTERVFETFKDLHLRKDVATWPISVNFLNLSAISTLPTCLSVLLKVYVPHLNVVYNHSLHRLDSHTPFDQLWQIFGRAVRMEDFYLFHEVQVPPSPKDRRCPVPSLELLQAPLSVSSSSYWPIISKIFKDRLSLKIKFQKPSSQFILSNLVSKNTYILHSFVLVPGIQSLVPKLRLERPLKTSSSANLVDVISLDGEDRRTPSKSVVREPLDEQPSTGKRPHAGLTSFDSSKTCKPIKKVQTSKEGPEVLDCTDEPFELKKSLVFLDLSILLTFVDLFRSFDSLLYANVSKPDTKLFRKVLVEGDCSDKSLFKSLYKRFLNEKHYLNSILIHNQDTTPDKFVFPNGNLFYGNTPFDDYFDSIIGDISDSVHKTNPEFSTLKCTF